ncbi:MAG: GlsB/YeaQ/YmgE family stress response membrane protein [Acidimicrobiia bacterium]|nr:GlsB/YeaQ/YmgE family stress response membrane protein [Acidimicrobiia bacterium]
MSWVSWIIVGFLSGIAAKAVTGQDRPGCLGTVVVGILGGLLGGAIFKAAGDEGINDFSFRSLLVAFVGATVLLFVWSVVGSRDRS